MFFSKEYSNKDGLELDGFVLDKELRIPEYYWLKINSEYAQDEIKDSIIDTVQRLDLPVPGSFVTDASKKDALMDFKRAQSLDSNKIIQYAPQRVVTRHNYIYPISDYFLQMSSVGNDASDFFHREHRVGCGTVKFKSPSEAWNNPDTLHYCLRALWSLKYKEVNSNYLYAALALRQYGASQFRVSSAKAIYELFNAELVLDTSSGWGDRYAGFSAASHTKQYVGIDPNSKLHPGYRKQCEMYSTGKSATFIEAPAEDVVLPVEYFDLMFTSPPYFETERYSDEETQSWKRYKEFDSWLENFLFVVVRKAWRSIKPGGYLAMNIADLGVTYSSTGICDSMNNYIGTLKGAHYVGCLGLRLAIRPGTGIQKLMPAGPPIFIEPIWIWRKGKDDSLKSLVHRFRKRTRGAKTFFNSERVALKEDLK